MKVWRRRRKTTEWSICVDLATQATQNEKPISWCTSTVNKEKQIKQVWLNSIVWLIRIQETHPFLQYPMWIGVGSNKTSLTPPQFLCLSQVGNMLVIGLLLSNLYVSFLIKFRLLDLVCFHWFIHFFAFWDHLGLTLWCEVPRCVEDGAVTTTALFYIVLTWRWIVVSLTFTPLFFFHICKTHFFEKQNSWCTSTSFEVKSVKVLLNPINWF